MTNKMWLRGLVAAAISGAVGAFTSMIVDPEHFNLFAGGAKALAEMAATQALVGAVLYLKQHPLPDQAELDALQLKVDQKAADAKEQQ